MTRHPAVAAAVLALLAAAPAAWPQAPADPRAEPVVTSLTLFAGTTQGLWRSRDWGGSWEPVRGKEPGARMDGVGRVHAVVALGVHVFVAAAPV